jgi:hypothetical protein
LAASASIAPEAVLARPDPAILNRVGLAHTLV